MAWQLRYTALSDTDLGIHTAAAPCYWWGLGESALKTRNRWVLAGFCLPATVDPNHRSVLLRTLYQHLWQGYQHLETRSVLTKVQSLLNQIVASQAPIPIQMVIIWIEKHENQCILYTATTGGLHVTVERELEILPIPSTAQGVSGWLLPEDKIWIKPYPSELKPTQLRHWQPWATFHHHSPGIGLWLDRRAWWRTMVQPWGQPPLTLGSSSVPLPIPKPVLRKRQVALGLALIFFALLAIAMWLGMRKRAELTQTVTEQQLVDDVTYRLNQAQALKTLNPTRAKTLLEEAQTTLESYTQEPSVGSQLPGLKQALTQAFAEVDGQYLVDQPAVFFDLNLIKEGFKPSQLSLAETDLVLLDDQSQTLVQFNLNSKAGSILAGSDLVPKKSRLASIPAWAFLTTSDTVHILDKQTQEQVSSFHLSKISIDTFLGYSNNAYVLDRDHNQIWRFRGTQTGLAKPEPFFETDEDLSRAVDMSIDGSLWLLYRDGGLAKFTSGIKDAFYPSLKLDEPLTNPNRIFTSETADQLYIWEKSTARIVAVTKKAEYTAVYRWQGLTASDDFVVSPEVGKILVLKDGVLYGINLK